jgi:hypothetical protein
VSEPTVALVLLFVAVPLLWGLMWLGWRGRGRRQAGLAELPAVPEQVTGDVLEDVEGVYVTSTMAGETLERVVVHGLGVRSAAVLRVSGDGVLVARQGAQDLWIPRSSLRGVRQQRGMVGKFVDAEGLVVLTWELGDSQLDTGIRLRHKADRERLVEAVTSLTEVAR